MENLYKNIIYSNFDFSKFKDFIGKSEDYRIYLHNTNEVEIADTIVNCGFEYKDYLENSTDQISGMVDEETKYFLLQRKSYGIFTIVIHIGHELVEYYATKISKEYIIPYIFTSKAPYINDDNETVCVLHNQFIKGYYNRITNNYFINEKYAPNKNQAVFENNLQLYLSKNNKAYIKKHALNNR